MGIGIVVLGGLLLTMVLGGTLMPDQPEPGEEVISEDDTTLGSYGDDLITGDGSSELILPDSGEDVVHAGGGNDTVSDVPFDGKIEQTVLGPINPLQDDDVFYGDGGNDVLQGAGGWDELYGGTGDDTLLALDLLEGADYAPDILWGEAGNDELIADDGDTLRGGEGVDFFGLVVDSDGNAPVVIEDFEPGEEVEILVFDPELVDPEYGISGAFRDTDEGAVLSVDGFDAVIFRDVLVNDLKGAVRLYDETGSAKAEADQAA
jgi:Ca2+-binding RTX toxin-like protein